MQNPELPYGASFRLWHGQTQVSFYVNEPSPDDLLAALDYLLAAANTAGYTDIQKGLENDEQVVTVDGYVVGETKKGDFVIWLYDSNHRLQWRRASVYQERFGEMPFTVNTEKVWPAGAPDRETAEQKGILISISPPLEIIMKHHPYRKTEDGKPVWVYDRVKGKPASKPSKTVDVESMPSAKAHQQLMAPLMDKLDTLGGPLYGDGWQAKRRQLCAAVSHGRTEDVADLTEREINTLISGIEKKAEEALAAKRKEQNNAAALERELDGDVLDPILGF
jgi:hypothetical protein